MSVHDLDPTWPHGAHVWASFTLLVLLGLFKLDRGTIMLRRARYVDRFGASIITFDLVFGVTFLFSSLRMLYPPLARNDVLFWATLVPLFAAMTWQWIEVRIAIAQRLEVALAGATAEHDQWEPGDPERRVGPADRRRSVADVYSRNRGDD